MTRGWIMGAVCVLAGLVLLVGGFAYLTTGEQFGGKSSEVMTRGSDGSTGFTALPPGEHRQLVNQRLEDADRQPGRIRDLAPQVMSGESPSTDADLDPTASGLLGGLRPDGSRARSPTAAKPPAPAPKPSPASP